MDFAAHAQPSADRDCRSIVLEWLGRGLEERLPGRALRHRPFSHHEAEASCRAVRIRGPERDLWALQVERTTDPGSQVTTSLTVATNRGHPTTIGVEVHDRSAAPGRAVDEYPSGLVAGIAGRIPLLQNGRRFVRDPILLDTEGAMRGFLDKLVDPMRDMPFAVVSLPPEESDGDALAEQRASLARALAGLAVVWVLPPAMTYRLSDAVGKRLSAFNGAWRFYRPGFSDSSDWAGHPLLLKKRLADERGLDAATRRFQRLAAEDRLRFGHGDRDTLGFDAVANEAEATPSVRKRLVAFVRKAIGRDSTAPARQRSPADGADASSRPDSVPGSGARRDGNAASPAGHGAKARPRTREGARAPRRKLAPAPDKARTRTDRRRQARRRAAAAERENVELRKRVEQLTGLVRTLGGDPDAAIPFPVEWDQVADWCDQSLADRVSLTGSARREMGGAEFTNVGLAAQCLSWLGREYRDGRLRGGAPDLHGRIGEIDEGVFNLPCGGDAFECTWNRRRRTVDWHIKNGANTRDPRRCLRIYYFWDEDTRTVVVASMPSHRRNALT